ncbi:hypothetical protein A3727_10505 [Erythrobacter sp. HI0038]|nr:hypothetical protein A3719_12355 [Erythrobacter sp. HI0020]KZY13668.1 hypothetical protein A3727_10505 [Erythrobacter sp. HI0038]
MALSNVGALLAKNGKRVLLVDFDLEAPGITSYGPFVEAKGLPGIVDIVDEYRTTGKSPKASEFIVHCELGEGESIWVLPAGDNKSNAYGEKLAGIDWGKLYEEQQGFAFFEDLKNQWASFEGIGFDYVLIDSRTGHTDIGGICTRHLPDAVVVLFVPTEQNIIGLEPIVKGIRRQSAEKDQGISLAFCPSNIPDEYDEDAILGQILADAAKRLGYGKNRQSDDRVVEIHHWSLMDLLQQPLIVESRPRSRLAAEYGKLCKTLATFNLEDREGALIAAQALIKLYDEASAADDSDGVERVLATAARISLLHPRDGELASKVGEVFLKASNFEQAEVHFGEAIDAGFKRPRTRLRRAIALTNLNRRTEALSEIENVLKSQDASPIELTPAVQMLRRTADTPNELALELFLSTDTPLRSKEALFWVVSTERENLAAIGSELKRCVNVAEESKYPDLVDSLKNMLTLALIGSGQFEEALEITFPDDNGPAPIFNRALALWGLKGEVRSDLLEQTDLLLKGGREADPNNLQCRALIKAILGEREAALSILRQAERSHSPRTLNFSCWTYLTREGDDFLKDLREMRALVESGDELIPPFIKLSQA